MSDVALQLDDEAMLARLAACDLAAAERVHAKLMEAEEAAELADLGRTYQRLARSLRQTLALKARLAREREAADAKKRPPKPEPLEPHAGLTILTAQARAHVEAAHDSVVPYVERERPDYDDLDEAEVYEILIELAQDREFLDTPIEALVAKVLKIMELPGLADESREPESAQPALQDSA